MNLKKTIYEAINDLLYAILFLFPSCALLINFIKKYPKYDTMNVVIFCIGIITGLYLLFIGFKKIVLGILTEKKGVECYAIINNIKENNRFKHTRYLVTLTLYIEKKDKVIKIHKIIGLDSTKHYPVGAYYKAKYYNNFINITDEIDMSMIPEEIIQKLKI